MWEDEIVQVWLMLLGSTVHQDWLTSWANDVTLLTSWWKKIATWHKAGIFNVLQLVSKSEAVAGNKKKD